MTEPFQVHYWFADGVVVGTVVAVNDETFDFKVSEWIRARGCPSPKIVRATRYTIPTDSLPQDPEPLSVGWKFLLVLRKPYDDGAGDNPYWIVLHQINLASPSVCLTEANGLWISEEQVGCPQPVKRSDYLDALRSFDRCFVLYDDPLQGTIPNATKCSDQAIKSWAGRSALHAALAKRALRAIERHSLR